MDDPGFAIHAQVFEPSEMSRVLQTLATAEVARTKAGIRHLLSVPMVRDLAQDPRLRGRARQFLGPDAVPFRATLFDKSQAANWLVVWHQDTALPLRARIEDDGWGPWSSKGGMLYAHAPAWALGRVVALRVHLDDSTLTNGPLRVLPHSHVHGVLDEREIEHRARAVAAVDCVAPAGGVVAMRPLVVHASSKSTDARPRRVLHIEYADALSLADGIELALA
jgi:hypothetical protein